MKAFFPATPEKPPRQSPTLLRTVLAFLLPGEEVPSLIPQETCGEVCDVLDPWPLVRRVPDVWRR